MNEKKLDRAIKCLYAVAAIKVATAIYVVSGLVSWNDFSLNGITSTVFLAAAIAVLAIVTAKNLLEQKLWAWISGISLFVFCAASLALPACILGFLSLLDAEVRAPFIKELDIKL